jgi:transcriptional regulator with XRE-family HTH domain
MLGERLKELMDARGITTAELARRCDLSAQGITLIRDSVTKPEKIRASTIESLAKELGTTWQYLLHGTGPAMIDIPQRQLDALMLKYLSLSSPARHAIETTIESFARMAQESSGRYK